MDFVNESKLSAGWTMGFDRDGRELVVVAVKGTFAIPRDGEEAVLADEQLELVEADEFTGEPGLTAPLHEVDYAHRKPMCDVVLNGSAYAPRGKAARRVDVGVRVGSQAKVFSVVGNRIWRESMLGLTTSDAEPFESMPFSYDNAFGGAEPSPSDPSMSKTFLANPVGRGFSFFNKDLDGRPLPNTEEQNRPVTEPGGHYRPMALGPIGRSWVPRVAYAGTYDQTWLDEQAPFWPDDFDYRYFQSAPADQQIPFPSGGEEVVLKNLTPDGYVAFRLPTMQMPICFVAHTGRDWVLDAGIDTVVIEPDCGTFALTWRVAVPMRRSCFDLKRVIAGATAEARTEYRGKPYYRGLAELTRARRKDR